MKKRNLLALTMAGALTLTLLAGCSKNGDTTPPETTPPTVTDPVSPTPDVSETPEVTPGDTTPPVDPTTPPETETPSDKPTDSNKPAATPKPSDKPTASPKPPATPAPSPSEKPVTSKVQSAWDEISKLEMPSMMDVDSATLSSLYGINSADLVEYVCKMPMVNVQATEFFLAEVKDGKMDTVKAAVEQRQADLETQWSSYLPDQLELVQNYKLVTNGNYILFVISEDADSAVSSFNTYTK